MTIGFNAAAAAYTAALNRKTTAGAAPAAAGSGFADLVRQAADTAIGTMRGGEKAALSAAVGKPDLTQVVTAVSNAEVTLQAAVAVRDKVIQAYLDVIRMPI